jgi:hypothetical protein
MTLRQGLARSPAGGEAAPRWRRALRLAVLAVIVVVVAAVIAGQWRSVRPLLGRLDPATVGGAAAAVFGGIYATFLSWRAVLADLGAPLPVAGGMRVFFLGQLGKYLPGSLWPAMTQMELGRDYKVPQRASGAAVVVFMLMVVGTGLLVAVPLVLLTGGDAARRYGWIAAVLPLALVAAVPPVLNRLLGLALRLARRPALPAPLSLGGVLRAAGWSLAAWFAYGVHAWVLARRLGAAGEPLLLLRVTGAFAAAWCAGFLLVVAPAGAGVREAALVLLLGPVMTTAQATVLAVVSRLLFVVGDAGWGAVAALVARRPRAPASGPQGRPDGGPGERGGDLADLGDPGDEAHEPGR